MLPVKRLVTAIEGHKINYTAESVQQMNQMKINYLRNQSAVCWSNSELYHKIHFFTQRTVNPLGTTMQGCPELAQHGRKEKPTLKCLTVNIKSNIVSVSIDSVFSWSNAGHRGQHPTLPGAV